MSQVIVQKQFYGIITVLSEKAETTFRVEVSKEL
jgi:hypothetical protein